MTRRGSLAYYLAAWVCGCFFMSLAIWLGNRLRPTAPPSVPLLLYIYFLSLMLGAVASLLFGFLLRSAADAMHWNRIWHWLLGGAILAPALIAILETVASSQALEGSGWRFWISAALTGPYLSCGRLEWMLVLTIPVGIATAWVLSRVHCAFAQQPK